MVNIVVLGSSPEWDEVVKRPWELVSGVSVDSLEKTEDNPDVHGDDMEVSSESTPDDWDTDGSETKSHNFNRRGEFSGDSKWGGVLVVEFVNTTVERTPVESTMEPIMPGILADEEDGDLVSNCLP